MSISTRQSYIHLIECRRPVAIVFYSDRTTFQLVSGFLLFKWKAQ